MRIQRTLPVLLLTAGVFVVGCGGVSFDGRFKEIKIGDSREAVKRRLGPPDANVTATVPPLGMGPRQGLRGVLGPNGTFEEWKYTRDGVDHYAWFGSTAGLPQKQWRVLMTSSIPVNAEF